MLASAKIYEPSLCATEGRVSTEPPWSTTGRTKVHARLCNDPPATIHRGRTSYVTTTERTLSSRRKEIFPLLVTFYISSLMGFTLCVANWSGTYTRVVGGKRYCIWRRRVSVFLPLTPFIGYTRTQHDKRRGLHLLRRRLLASRKPTNRLR
jgi:hypothetical protein